MTTLYMISDFRPLSKQLLPAPF